MGPDRTLPDAPAVAPIARRAARARATAAISDAPARSSVVASREPPPVEAASIVVADVPVTTPDDPGIARPGTAGHRGRAAPPARHRRDGLVHGRPRSRRPERHRRGRRGGPPPPGRAPHR
ncbi:MAG: hypothetical protein R3F43_30310 [bacterium]